MKITSNTPAAQMGGMQANAFQLTNSAKIIDIVINKMYTNKPGAVIRELAANAWDAHCEADNRGTPFEIHLPTWLEKTFMIRDYGIGIPHHLFENIYTNIGGSTKDTSDDLIGGFGLGSKTPFTMVDSFTVENWRDGEKSTWLCFKDAGNPQVTMLSREPSDEPNGVKVSFVFEEDEVAEFTKQLTKQLKYFPTKPTITGGEGVAEWDELPDGWQTQDYFYSKQRGVASWNRTHYVVMGNVAYDLDESMFHEFSNLFNESLTLKVPIGAVDIPPSRENLEYTTRTKKYISDMLSTIRKKYNDDFLAEVDQCKDYLSLRKKFHGANARLISMRKYTFDGKEYEWNTLAHHQLKNTEHNLTVKRIEARYANVFRSCTIQMNHVSLGINLYINDLGVGASNHINLEYQKIAGDNAYIIDPTKGTKATRQTLFDADLATATKFFGMVPKLLSKEIGMPSVAAKAARAKPDQIFKVTTQGATVKASVTSVTDIPTSGYMLPMSGWDVEEGHFKGLIPKIGSFAEELDDIYLVRKFTRKDVVGLEGEKELIKAIDDLLVPRVQKYLNAKGNQELVPRGEMTNLNRVDWKEVDPTIHLLIKYSDRQQKHHMNHWEYSRASSLITIKDIAAKPFVTARLQKMVKQYKTKYQPLVQALSHGWNSVSNFKALHTFIKQENK